MPTTPKTATTNTSATTSEEQLTKLGKNDINDVQAALKEMEKELKLAKRRGKSLSRSQVMDRLLNVVDSLEPTSGADAFAPEGDLDSSIVSTGLEEDLMTDEEKYDSGTTTEGGKTRVTVNSNANSNMTGFTGTLNPYYSQYDEHDSSSTGSYTNNTLGDDTNDDGTYDDDDTYGTYETYEDLDPVEKLMNMFPTWGTKSAAEQREDEEDDESRSTRFSGFSSRLSRSSRTTIEEAEEKPASSYSYNIFGGAAAAAATSTPTASKPEKKSSKKEEEPKPSSTSAFSLFGSGQAAKEEVVPLTKTRSFKFTRKEKEPKKVEPAHEAASRFPFFGTQEPDHPPVPEASKKQKKKEKKEKEKQEKLARAIELKRQNSLEIMMQNVRLRSAGRSLVSVDDTTTRAASPFSEQSSRQQQQQIPRGACAGGVDLGTWWKMDKEDMEQVLDDLLWRNPVCGNSPPEDGQRKKQSSKTTKTTSSAKTTTTATPKTRSKRITDAKNSAASESKKKISGVEPKPTGGSENDMDDLVTMRHAGGGGGGRTRIDLDWPITTDDEYEAPVPRRELQPPALTEVSTPSIGNSSEDNSPQRSMKRRALWFRSRSSNKQQQEKDEKPVRVVVCDLSRSSHSPSNTILAGNGQNQSTPPTYQYYTDPYLAQLKQGPDPVVFAPAHNGGGRGKIKRERSRSLRRR